MTISGVPTIEVIHPSLFALGRILEELMVHESFDWPPLRRILCETTTDEVLELIRPLVFNWGNRFVEHCLEE